MPSGKRCAANNKMMDSARTLLLNILGGVQRPMSVSRRYFKRFNFATSFPLHVWQHFGIVFQDIYLPKAIRFHRSDFHPLSICFPSFDTFFFSRCLSLTALLDIFRGLLRAFNRRDTNGQSLESQSIAREIWTCLCESQMYRNVLFFTFLHASSIIVAYKSALCVRKSVAFTAIDKKAHKCRLLGKICL